MSDKSDLPSLRGRSDKGNPLHVQGEHTPASLR
jgi:hypothetical protein